MALAHSPKVVTDGLVFAYDMGNADKSWKGKPTTNVIENDISLFSSDNGCTIELQPHTFQGQPVYRVTFPSGTLPRIRTNFSYTTGQQFTGSIFYRVISAGSDTVNLIFRENNFGTTYTSTGLTSTGWVKTNISHTFSGSGTSMFLLYQSNSGATLPNVIDFCMPQVELSSFATPFVDGTRSSTQAILDLTKQNTVTATSLTYASDGTFSFDGSSNVIVISGPVSSFFTDFSQQITLSTWIRIPAAATWTNGYFGNILSRSSYAGSIGLWRTTEDNQVVAFLRQAGATYGAVSSYGTIERDVWANITATWTGNSLSMYINGVVSETNTGTIGGANIADWTMGSVTAAGGNVGNRFQGEAGITQIYNRALTAEEVAQNFNAHRGRYGI